MRERGQYAPSFKTPQGSGVDESGNLIAGALGAGLSVKQGANGRSAQNAGPLVAGTVVVPNTSVKATDQVLVTGRGDGAAVGGLNENRAARVPGVSFTVVSTNAADVQHFDYTIIAGA